MRKRVLIIFINVFLLFSFISSKAQHVNLSNFYLIPNNKEVLLYWTIDSGPTCNGITVWHSSDSVNYEEIGNIGGVCGSSSSATPYNFTDKSPLLNLVNYYKLRLGYAQFTEVKTITLKYTEPGKLYVYPNPSINQAKIEFNNDRNKQFSLTVSNSIGNVIYKKDGVVESEIFLDTSSWNNGSYYITLTDDSGNVLKEKLIITK